MFKPSEYPGRQYYEKNEASISDWNTLIDRLHAHNPDCEVFITGGEPFIELEKLISLVKRMNDLDMDYTICSSLQEEVEGNVREFFKKVDKVNSIMISADPYLDAMPDTIKTKSVDENREIDDEKYKTYVGYIKLVDIMSNYIVMKPKAEIVCDVNTIRKLTKTVEILDKSGICSYITLLDDVKNQYYDYSNIMSSKELVNYNRVIGGMFESLAKSDYNIYRKEDLLKLFNSKTMPTNSDCELEKGLRNISVDSDATLRLCTRIKGRDLFEFKASDLFNNDGTYSKSYDEIYEIMVGNKQILCVRCSDVYAAP